MAITCIGFDGTMSEANLAVWAPLVGSAYPQVGDYNHFAVTAGGGGDRAVTVAAGRLAAFGVAAVSDTAVVLNAGAVSSGPTRYDTVVLRITWSSNSAALVVVPGGPLGSIAAALQKTPGVVYDVPLAVIQVSSTATAIVSVLDVRNWGGNTVTVASLAGLPPATAVPRGTLGLVAAATTAQPGDLYVAAGASWAPLFKPKTWSALDLTDDLQQYTAAPQYTIVQGEVILRGGIQRKDVGRALATANTSKTLFTLPPGARPGRVMRFPLATTYEGQALTARLTITPDDGRAEFAAPVDDTVWVHIDGIRFFAEQ